MLPAFYRLIWPAHVVEFADLSPLQRLSCMDALTLIESTLCAQLQPDKINLASLGNVVPHLHWHVIARWRMDAYWSQSAWSAAQRKADAAQLNALRMRLPAVDVALAEALKRTVWHGIRETLKKSASEMECKAYETQQLKSLSRR